MDVNGKTPLHLATNKDNHFTFNMILKKVKDKNPKDSSGTTPLHIAAKYGYLRICIDLLQQFNGDLMPTDNAGRTPLHYAAEYGNFHKNKRSGISQSSICSWNISKIKILRTKME